MFGGAIDDELAERVVAAFLEGYAAPRRRLRRRR
jgi:hypothetical protein